MQITGTRFGEIDVDAKRVIALRNGMIGFPGETRFVLLRPKAQRPIAWLQSLQNPALAFPVVESTQIAPPYPVETHGELAGQAGIDSESVSVFVVVSVRPKGPGVIANLLAPIVVDRATGNGAQIVLDAKKYSASTPLATKVASAPPKSEGRIGVIRHMGSQ
jgi:flagellar assembly factor FliW